MATTPGAWRWYLGIGSVLAIAHLALPDSGDVRPYAFLLIALSAPLAMLVGIGRRPRSWPWTLVLVGTALMVAGDVLWTYYETIADVDPFPSLADALYLPGYPLIALGLLLMLRTRGPGREQAVLIDATIIAIGCGVLSWVYLVAPYIGNLDLGLAERVVSAAYPLMGVLLVAVVARLGFTGGRLRVSDLLVGLGVLALLIADTYLAALELTVGYDWHAIPEVLWLGMYVLFGAGALAVETEPFGVAARTDRATAQLPRMRLPLLLVASLTAPGVLAWQGIGDGDTNLLVIAIASAVLFVLVLARVFGLVGQVEAKAVEVARMAATDSLTGLANRRRWNDEIARLLTQTRRTGSPLCVAMIDLDHFKRYNDAHGHDAGDALLRDCAAEWRRVLREADVLARVGGEEFALALPSCSIERAEQVIDRLRSCVPGDETFSAGVAPWDGRETAQALKTRADVALYAAKAAGRNRTVRADVAVANPVSR